MPQKKLIMLGMFAGSVAVGYLPSLFGFKGLMGIWVGYAGRRKASLPVPLSFLGFHACAVRVEVCHNNDASSVVDFNK